MCSGTQFTCECIPADRDLQHEERDYNFELKNPFIATHTVLGLSRLTYARLVCLLNRVDALQVAGTLDRDSYVVVESATGRV